MYIETSGRQYHNIQCRPGDTMIYRGVPEDIPLPTAPVRLCADDGFELRSDDPADYLRVYLEGDALIMTNLPAPEPPPEPGPAPTEITLEDVAEMLVDQEVRIAALEIMGGGDIA